MMKIQKMLKGAVAAGILGLSGMAFAVTPANTTLTNTAQLMYTGLSTPISASVDVTVSLTPSAPVVGAPYTVPPDQTTSENQTVTYTYWLVAQANGSDVYDLSGSLTPTNLASTSAAPQFYQGVALITSITLGATSASTAANIGDTVIQVPSDGTAGGGVNSLVAGDIVVIDGNAYTIASVSDNGVTASITLASALTTTVSVGELIPEAQSFTAVIADVGSVNPSGAAANVIMDITATSQADPGQVFTDQTLTTVVEVAFQKMVRNVTNPNGSGGATNIGGQNYFTTAGGVTAESGDVLEYVLRVTASATGALTGVTLTDSIPAFTTYVANSTMLNGAAAGAADVAGNSPLIAGFSVNDPSSGLNSGNVAAGTSAVVTFQVTVQ